MKITHLTWRPKNWVTLLWFVQVASRNLEMKILYFLPKVIQCSFWRRTCYLTMTKEMAYSHSILRCFRVISLSSISFTKYCNYGHALGLTCVEDIIGHHFSLISATAAWNGSFLDLSRILRSLYFLISSHTREKWQPLKENNERGFMEEILQIFD